MLLVLPNAPPNLFPYYSHLFYQRSNPLFSVTIANQWVVWILKNSKDVWGIYNQGPSPPAIAFKHLTPTLYTTIPHSKAKRQIKRISQTVFYNKKEWPT